ncbi:hypothetical protein [Elioraea thermophila]|uniref:hypothetical protein n=1 Tax=Elioraea thermophila TaxID=2185104 RepID=UPI000DF40D7C|nr:hypothetical protein [Elioraea thermophila]
MPPHALLALLALPTLLPLPAAAQQVIVGGAASVAASSRLADAALILGLSLLVALILFGLVAVWLHRSLTRMAEWCGEPIPGAQAAEIQAARLKAFLGLKSLPLGLPEGTVRAALGLVIVTLGLTAILFQRSLGLPSTGEIAGLLGTVLGFYFGARGAGAEREREADAAREAEAKAARAEAEARSAAREAEAAKSRSAREIAAHDAARDGLSAAAKLASGVKAAAEAIAAADPSSPLAREAARAAALAETTLTTVAAGQAGDLAEAAARAAGLAASLAPANPLAALAADTARGIAPALARVPALAAAVGGPLGLVGAVLAGGLQAARVGAEHYRRWVARVLDRPYGLDLYPEGLADAPMSLAALERAPIFARLYRDILAARDLAAARALMVATLAPDAPARLLAGEGALPPRPLGTEGGFASERELEEGLAEYRRALLDGLLDAADPRPVSVPLPEGPRAVGQGALRAALDAAREDLGAAAALDRLALAAGRLAQAEAAPDLADTLARAAREIPA